MSSARSAQTKPIADYAVIGNCRSAALVAKDGSIDFLCWPRFDSPALFSALLDTEHGGLFSIRPIFSAPADIERCYVSGTAVLRTTFSSAEGQLTLTDCMTITSDEDDRTTLSPENEILRMPSALAGVWRWKSRSIRARNSASASRV